MRGALATAVSIALLGAVPAGAAVAPRASVLGLESALICVQCHEPLDMSTSPLAQQMKSYIRRFVAEGWTTKQIEAYFVGLFGEQVLASPPTHGFNLLAWVIPIVLGGVGLVVVGAGAWAWTRSRDDVPEMGLVPAAAGGAPLTPALERRVEEELARFDG